MAISAGFGATLARRMDRSGRIGEIAADVVGSFAGTLVELVDDLACGMIRATNDIIEQRNHIIEKCK